MRTWPQRLKWLRTMLTETRSGTPPTYMRAPSPYCAASAAAPRRGGLTCRIGMCGVKSLARYQPVDAVPAHLDAVYQGCIRVIRVG